MLLFKERKCSHFWLLYSTFMEARLKLSSEYNTFSILDFLFVAGKMCEEKQGGREGEREKDREWGPNTQWQTLRFHLPLQL